jgi:hypothetical protein
VRERELMFEWFVSGWTQPYGGTNIAPAFVQSCWISAPRPAHAFALW